MGDWLEQYSAALDERNKREQAHKPYIDAYTRLADRKATLESRPPQSLPSPTPASPSKDSQSAPTKGRGTPSKDLKPAPELLARLKADYATIQKARSQLQNQIDELTTSVAALQAKDKASTAQTANLTKQRQLLERRVRDREEEIRGKQKLVQDAQDDVVALELQLNMSEQRSKKLEKENKELVDRWMKRMGEEAERINTESKWE